MPKEGEAPSILALARSETYTFTKPRQSSLRLLEGLGVEGDVHSGKTVKHRSRMAADPTQPNLRQVHLIQSELFDEVRAKGFEVSPGEIGENVTTRGIDLLALPTGTILEIGQEARIEITDLRNPCVQIERFQKGLLGEVLERDDAGEMIRRAGVMAIVMGDGTINVGDPIEIVLPAEPHRPLEKV